MRRMLGTLFLVLLALVGLVSPAVAGGRRGYTGEIGGAKYRVEVPDHWNGTVVVYSHPYYVEGMPTAIGLANRPETEEWLLDHGYALAGSDFNPRTGFVIEQAVRDQGALLDWFGRTVGRPRDVVATGSSLGAAVSLKLAERYPGRITGVAPLCGPLDLNGTFNMALDVTFALRTLLAPGQDIGLVHPRNPAHSVELLQQAVNTAMTTKEGRARLALAASFANTPGWDRALAPKPADLAGQLAQQVEITSGFWVQTFGPGGRPDLEAHAGGNPSWNVGVDYGRQLAKSSQRDLVEAAYRDAGISPDADLAKLAAAPRIAPDPAAVGWMYRNAVITGTQRAPVITLHNIADAADPANERWLADLMRGRSSDLRQVWAGRATHCAFTASEEIVTLQALFTKMRTGRWPNTPPAAMTAAAKRLPARYQLVYDYPTNTNAQVTPSLVPFTPGVPLRPSR
ncbi:hypothetical protein [Actinocrispum sp. NPDC049592]|uniref:hypothetical protein n=1 Tax=Actinocrispum sp. NPDC049592 TaxID=3154835 RepID=UPI00341D8B54